MRRHNPTLFVIIFFVALIIVEGWLVVSGFQEYEREVTLPTLMPNAGFHKLTGSDPVKIANGQDVAITAILLNVPFTSQAPLGSWGNVIFQQGCEEASIFMAMLWIEGKVTSSAEAAKAIEALSRFEAKTYGEFRDTSAEDSVRLIRDYFHYENFEVRHDIGVEDIRRELAGGSLVIVPVNGQKMGNPFYTPPGPIQHMVVVGGYDTKTKEFITNDPGTKHGEGFRYKEAVLEGALQDYGTGYKEPIYEVRTAMIAVKPLQGP